MTYLHVPLNWLVFFYQIKYESTIELYKKKLGKLRGNTQCLCDCLLHIYK